MYNKIEQNLESVCDRKYKKNILTDTFSISRTNRNVANHVFVPQSFISHNLYLSIHSDSRRPGADKVLITSALLSQRIEVSTVSTVLSEVGKSDKGNVSLRELESERTCLTLCGFSVSIVSTSAASDRSSNLRTAS